MAYNDNEFQVIVQGGLEQGEIWSNTWTILNVSETEPRSAAVSRVHSMYSDLDELFSNQWTAEVALIKSLDTGLSVPGSWETITGTSVVEIMPRELAIRVSLNSETGVKGGPYLCGFTASSNRADGMIEDTTVTQVLGAVDGLASGLVADGYQLRIDRPTVETTVVAAQARVGRSWDVIRKRGGALLEAYQISDLLI